LGPHFEPVRVEIWRDAPSKAEGGSLIKESSTLRKARTFFVESPHAIFLIVEGMLRFGDWKQLAYVRINPLGRWRQVYGDVEFGAYDVEIADLFLTHIEARKAFRRSLENIRRFVVKIVIGWGIECLEDFRLGVAFYRSGKSFLLTDIMSTMRIDEKCKKLVEHLGPYNRIFLATRAWKEPGFRERMRKVAEEAQVLIQGRKSIILEAKERKSFSSFYEGIVKNVIRPLVEELPPKQEILKRIAKALIPPSQLFLSEEFSGE
jgi:hypothetical protein